MDKRWLTAWEAAEYLDVSPRTLHNWKQRGQVVASKLGRVLRYSVTELEACMARQAVSAIRKS